jgi:hypothetical protein
MDATCCTEVGLIKNPFLACAEQSIRLYPTWNKIRSDLERNISRTSLPGGFSSRTKVQGGEHVPQQERYIERLESNSLLCRLRKNCELVEGALRELTDEEREFVDLFWWRDLTSIYGSHDQIVGRELGIADRSVWRWRRRILEKVEPSLRGIDPAVS